MNLKLRTLQKLAPLPMIMLLAFVPLSLAAQGVKVNFATPVVLAPTETPGAWYVDRFAPGAFASQQIAPDGTRNTLEESIYPSGYQAPDSFYNTQGRDYDLIAGTYSLTIQLYVPSAWATENARMAGFWATAIDTTNALGDYPIIEFQGPITSDLGGPGYEPNNGVPGFYGWNNVTGAFDFIGLPPGFHYNSWVQLTITVIPGVGFQYSVHDPESRHGVSIASPFGDTADATLGEVLLQGYNYDASYNIFWNNLTMSSPSLACSVGPSNHHGHRDGGHRPW